MKKNSIVIIAVLWMLVLAIFATAYITLTVVATDSGNVLMRLVDRIDAVQTDSSEAELLKRYSRLEEVRTIITERYYKEADDNELMLGAIRGMMASVDDPYTFYYTPEELLASVEHMNGTYTGIGIVLMSDKQGMLTVLRVFKGTPAERANIKPGDQIIKVNGNAVSGETTQQADEAIGMIKGSTGNEATLTLMRGSESFEVKLTLEKINTPRTDSKMLSADVGYIAIYEFMGDDVTGFKSALKELQSQGMKALVIDVRSNPGGILDHVVDICDMLLPEGLIVYTEERGGKRAEYYSETSALGIPMAVLTNGMSASASEILAGSLQDYGVAKIIGETTYGKGIVQEPIPFQSDGAGLQLTVATYFTPSGRSIHGTGIIPDIEVSMPEGIDAAEAELHPSEDPQLMRALEAMESELN